MQNSGIGMESSIGNEGFAHPWGQGRSKTRYPNWIGCLILNIYIYIYIYSYTYIIMYTV